MASNPPDELVRVPRWYVCLVAAGLLLACAGARASVQLRVASLQLPGVAMSDVHAVATTSPDGRPQLSLDAGKVTVPVLGWRGVGLSLVGQPQRGRSGAWQFSGHVTTHGAPGGALESADVTIRYAPDGGTLEVDAVQGASSLNALMPVDQFSHVQLQLGSLPLAWLRGVLAAAWPDGRVTAGKVSGTVALDLADDGTRVSGRVDIAGAGLDSKAGNIAAQGLGAQGSFRIELGAPAASVMFDGSLRGGQLLLGPLYAQLPAHPTNLHVATTLGPLGIRIESLDYNDPDALRVAGSMGFDRKGGLDELDLKQFAATFPAAYTRYGTTLMQNLTGLGQLQTGGSLVGSLDIGGKGFQAFDLHATDFSLEGDGRGVAVAGLDGSVDWRAGASRPATNLRWNALALDHLEFGPGKLALQDLDGALSLRAPVTTTFFGGSFQLARVAWRPDAAAAQRLSAAFSVTDVDLASLCKALGWPAFQGKLGGAVPDLSYRGDELAFTGGLSMHVFDGSVSVTGLAIKHPFGVAPEVAANIDLQQLDLAQITHVFDFGQITGRLDGDIHDLKLVDWKPTTFSARLSA
ncbi:MAG TPA: hypothetical protein VFL63_08270, partial [Rhodanobacteraceae bacterium]|nr:hypothetical protein [Rhodanobacteraceae bacterium]